MRKSLDAPSLDGVQQKVQHKIVKKRNKIDKRLCNVFVDELREIYWVENKLTKSVSKINKKVCNEELYTILENITKTNKKHVIELEKIFTSVGRKSKLKKSEPIAHLIERTKFLFDKTKRGIVRDTALVLIIQKLAHYKIAGYVTLSSLSVTKGKHISNILEELLDEEREISTSLSASIDSFIKED